jgi:hypothetical protein
MKRAGFWRERWHWLPAARPSRPTCRRRPAISIYFGFNLGYGFGTSALGDVALGQGGSFQQGIVLWHRGRRRLSSRL